MGDTRFDIPGNGAQGARRPQADLPAGRPPGAHFAPASASPPHASGQDRADAWDERFDRIPPSVRPRPSDTPVSPVRNAVSWLLAACGAAIVVLAIQLFIMALGTTGVVVVSLSLNQSISSDELIGTYMGPIMLVSQLVSLAVFLPWWRRLRTGSVIARRHPAGHPAPPSVAARLVSILLMGVGIQLVVGYALTFLLPLAPELEAEYSEIMSDPIMSELSALSLLITAIGAPITEELACRGVAFEFALRAVCPEQAPLWRDRKWCRATGEPPLPLTPIPPARFWIANAIQALLFGMLHLNVVQGAYAFASGMVFGWMTWRTGSLAWSMLLHLVVNFSSFFVVEISGVLEFAGVVPAVLLSVLMTAAGVMLFSLASSRTHASGEPGLGA